ncbi:hypothetical protein CIK05_01310 [Bdellovibrio sp. qaytius]|nr:hypothetical protein CIK05_01310 [Bdellovibrio sp. qaytius]
MKIGVNWKSLLGILVFVASHHAVADRKVVTDRKPLGKHGWVYSWNIYSDAGVPKAIGISVNGAAFKELPEDDMETIVLQPKAQYAIAPYKHFTLDWNPHGHEPDGIYTKPHFDYHFFFITSAEREAITCQDADALICTKAVPSSYIPADYAPTPAGVPKMGWHFVDLKAPEFNGQPFSATFIYGFYNGVTNFLEPMITLEYLKTKPHAEYPVRLSQNISHSGFYPQKYMVIYNHVEDTYSVVLADLLNRTSSL